MRERQQVRALVRLAIEEDLAYGDITSELTVPEGHRSRARLLAKEPLVLCGTPVIDLLFDELGRPVLMDMQAAEGSPVEAGTVLGYLEGETRHLLAAERTLLNFLQHLSGIATKTRQLVQEAPGLVILDTRKTTPGWRVLEKYAVRLGGARNHRTSLGDMILVKDNHVDANGGDIEAALSRVQSEKPFYMPVEVEVRCRSELEAAIAGGVEAVMLDNMDDKQLADSLAYIKERAPGLTVEISGRVRPGELRRLQELGVSCISSSAMVTAAVWADISMKIEASADRPVTEKRER